MTRSRSTHAKSALRVVIDTNVVVSALLFRSGRLAWVRDAWAGGRLNPVVSTDTLSELVRVLAYPKFSLDVQDQKQALAHYMTHAEAIARVATRRALPPCRDPAHLMFLRLAYAARVDALVTGDADLLALVARSAVSILSPSQLAARL